MAQTKFVTIESYGKINELGGILGPITTPFYLNINTIISLINARKVVYEVNPANISDKVQLTRKNVLNDNFNKIDTKVDKPIIQSSKNVVNTSKVSTPKVKHNKADTSVTHEISDSSIGVDVFIANNKS